MMRLEVLPDADRAAARAAAWIAETLSEAIAQRGTASLALSGGTTPATMLRELATQELSWPQVHVFQVDERAVPAGHASRNLRQLLNALSTAVQSSRIHAMPVEEADLDLAAARYAERLRAVTGTPPVLDLVHLGLGADGHTASLVPGDPALEAETDVVVAGVYQGSRRMTLTLTAINRARRRVFLVTGASKRDALQRLARADASIVAARVATEDTLIVSDEEASHGLA